MVSTLVTIPGYQVSEELYNGSRTLVYRGYRETDSLRVVIKLLKNPYPSFSELVQFRNQYTITKNLNSPLIIQTYSLQAYQNGYALVMEDFGGISLKDWGMGNGEWGVGESVESLIEFLEIAIALCNTLDILYRERIIHKDIKPANILINPETKQVKLIDFSIASLLPRETQTLINPNILEGTLAYISPEQTGRMNRGIDYRTDFYSLGVTFYELLTVELPFRSNDPMELVHCHIAKTPIPVHEINSQIPLVLSAIINKLMAKNAEDRYQSALGIKHDLEICLSQWEATGNIASFEIGQRDISDRFTIPEKLYGRETEVASLLQAFERVSLGSTEMMLVAGFSGIGKTAVVNEVHKPIVRQRGYFIKGKYDQFQRNIPFSAFVQAFRDLMGQLLSESDSQLNIWKSKILEVVGDNGQVLIEVIPELEQIIDPQPTATELSGSAAPNRFNLLIQKFVKIFTSVEHPLVMFLDDLQWADSASLNLLQLLMVETGHLLILGAYRDNEVSPVHPFILTVDEIMKTGAVVNTITLQPLSLTDMNQLVADTLNCELSLAQPLTELVYQKTKGNPFFATQFLKALYEDKQITFDWEAHHWQCNIAEVRALAISDDVVEFMALQLQKLPTETQNMLKLAACIGAQFDLHTLGIVAEKSLEEAATTLWKALQEGLIIPNTEIYKFFMQSDNASISDAAANPTYRFLHDRVQQAAYSLIPDQQKQAVHLKIGQLLQKNFSEIEREEKLFDIVGHLNRGQALINQQQEREALAKLNLKAGGKARSSTAYAAARIYLETGIDLLEVDCWLLQYDLTLNLYVAASEASYLNGDFQGMGQMSALVLQNAQTILDKVKIYEIQIIALTGLGQMLEAIAVGREALAQLGVELPTEVDEAKIGVALENLNHQLNGRQLEELVDLPLMSDRTSLAAMQLLGVLFNPILQGNPRLLPFLSTTMVGLSLQFGNAPASMVGYAIHGILLCTVVQDVKTGYRFGEVALNLLDRFNLSELKSLVLLLFGLLIQHRQEAFLAVLPTLKAGYTAGIETGDFLNAGYNIGVYINTKFFAGGELDTCEVEAANYSALMAQAKQYSSQGYLDMQRQMLRNLRETVSQPDCLVGTAYNETVMRPKHQQKNELSAIAVGYLYKLLLAYIFGYYKNGLDYIAQSKPYLLSEAGVISIPIFHFYGALTQLAIFPMQSETEQAEILAQVETDQTTLHQWAQNAPMNYLHKWHLVEAEKCRILGNKAEAMEQYDRAISLAKENQFLNEEALANELAAKFYLDWGKEKIAQVYMTEAYYCYARWGAKAKVVDLETRYPQLLVTILQKQQPSFKPTETMISVFSQTIQTSTLNNTSLSEALDLATILKASQSLSSEIELDKLLKTLLDVILKNAGADKCALLMPKGDVYDGLRLRWVIEALSQLEQPTIVLRSLPFDNGQTVPVTLINRVKNTLSLTVIDNAGIDPSLAADPYIIHHLPKSILCAPILNQGKLIGILYLENNLTVGAFTRDRLEVLHLLISQAAISLENARLYTELEDRVQERTQALNQKNDQLQATLKELNRTQTQMVQTEKMSALGQLVAGIAHEINNPISFIYGNLNHVHQYTQDLLSILNSYQNHYPNPPKSLETELEKLEFNFLKEDLDNILESMRFGSDRIRQIVLSLRNFSRLDESEYKAVNLHEGIDNTLMILQHRLNLQERTAIEIVKNYGELPLVKCYAREINQVFMNLLMNAIDAVEDSNRGRSFQEMTTNQNRILISTKKTEQNQVQIIIADNGVGIPEEIKLSLFNPFFTTKAVGKGTGLGLAIACQIVESTHGGKLSFNSVLGEGTKFIIEIPL
ncbi:MAG: AAA family ATPase [Nostoc sp. NOS(2021)]|uniref:trifunctional serine/threonine-protein kinase/ATP-binding protein/sensor histidine kinase n=1 Tax=Nostoc sp. NOS(2021) TaxID=2815407 RepID=UPI0025FB6E28|nr:ATP-binding sensor histidine kinase [Nostoc sp. NOS(2021)]MBN3899815.1 AAA family ATPase [Nostoc sp. NOS(2021)]